MSRKNDYRRTFSFPDWVKTDLAQVAAATGVDQAALVRIYVAEGLARHRQVSPPGVTARVTTVTGLSPETTTSPDPCHRQVSPPVSPPAPLILPPKKERVVFSPDRSGEVTERPCPCDVTQEAAALITTINQAAGTQLRPDDPNAQRVLFQRLTGSGLGPTDPGPATLAEVRSTVAHAAQTWTPQFLSLRALLGSKFWDHHGRAGAPAQRPAAPPPPPPPPPEPEPGDVLVDDKGRHYALTADGGRDYNLKSAADWAQEDGHAGLLDLLTGRAKPQTDERTDHDPE